MPPRSTTPLLSCRLYPGGSLYYRFNVWPSKEALRKHVHWARLGKNVPGVCSTFEVIEVSADGKRLKSRLCGEVNVVRRGLCIEIVTHEIAHAALGWAARTGIDPMDTAGRSSVMATNCGQEKFCYALGRMVRQAVRAINRAKVWT